MKIKTRLVRLASFGLFLIVALSRISPAMAQPYSQTIVMSGLDNPHGLAWGPDGGLYVAESGRGGNGPAIPAASGGLDHFGSSGAVSRWKDGIQERVLTGLPSAADEDGASATGLRDLFFQDDGTLVGLFGTAGVGDREGRDLLGPDAANLGQMVRLSLDGSGTVTPIADLVSFEEVTNPDSGPVESNPFRFTPAADGGFAVVDAAANSLLRVADDGDITLWTTFQRLANPLPFGPPMIDSVPTAVTRGPDGSYYVSELTGFPFPPGEANIYRYDADMDDLQVAFSGLTNLVDLAMGEDGTLYALQISDNGLASQQGPGNGLLWKIDLTTGDRTMLANDGLVAPTAVLPGPDGSLYITNFGRSAADGQVLRLAPVPEPSTLVLFSFACLVGLLRLRPTDGRNRSRSGDARIRSKLNT